LRSRDYALPWHLFSRNSEPSSICRKSIVEGNDRAERGHLCASDARPEGAGGTIGDVAVEGVSVGIG
jgi:hypothetical protein